MSRIARTTQCIAIGAAILWSASASAGTDPRGVWIDHSGRGAVQIKDCQKGPGLCGFVVHVKEKKHKDRCGTQILGNVTSKGGGWIYSPSRGRKYTVRIKRLSDSKLRVVGNASSSFFSKTFTWKRAPEDIELCGKYAVAKRRAPETKTETAVSRKVERKTVSKSARKFVRREEPVVDVKPERSAAKDFPSVAASEEAELERNSIVSDDEPGRYETEEQVEEAAGDEQEYGAIVEDEAGPGAEPVENEVSQVIDELIGKANKFTGKMKRKCKFRIPYVDRVVMIPCGD